MRPYSPEQLVNTLTCPVYQFIYQFGSKKAVFMKNIVRSEKTQKPKKRGVIGENQWGQVLQSHM